MTSDRRGGDELDVTEQIRARRELDASDQRYRSRFEESPEPVLLTTVGGS